MVVVVVELIDHFVRTGFLIIVLFLLLLLLFVVARVRFPGGEEFLLEEEYPLVLEDLD